MNDLLNILDKKIDFINKNNDKNNYFILENEFIDFVFKQNELAPYIEELILSNKINLTWLKKVYTNYVIHNIINLHGLSKNKKNIKGLAKQIHIPDFINKKTEKQTEFLYLDRGNVKNDFNNYITRKQNSLGINFHLSKAVERLQNSSEIKKDGMEKNLDDLFNKMAEQLDLKIYFEDKFNLNKFYRDIVEEYKIFEYKKLQTVNKPKVNGAGNTKLKEIETEYKDIKLFNDGTITCNDEELSLREQLRNLCIYFIKNPNRLLNYDDIKDEIINSEKILIIKNDTIPKYVEALKKELQKHSTVVTIKNKPKVGYIFE